MSGWRDRNFDRGTGSGRIRWRRFLFAAQTPATSSRGHQKEVRSRRGLRYLSRMGLKDALRIYSGRRVLVTGHTGFKGAWLCEWLLGLGAEVCGLALPAANPSLFFALQLERRMKHCIEDIRHSAQIEETIREMAAGIHFPPRGAGARARFLPRTGTDFSPPTRWARPICWRRCASRKIPCSIVAVTTDKCYRNEAVTSGDQGRRFTETDALGGHDPYSASKAAAEIVVASYRDSFFRAGHECCLGFGPRGQCHRRRRLGRRPHRA